MNKNFTDFAVVSIPEVPKDKVFLIPTVVECKICKSTTRLIEGGFLCMYGHQFTYNDYREYFGVISNVDFLKS